MARRREVSRVPRFEMAEDEVRDENMMMFLVLLRSSSSCDSGLFYAGSPWLVGDGVSQKEVSCLGGVRGYRGVQDTRRG